MLIPLRSIRTSQAGHWAAKDNCDKEACHFEIGSVCHE
jgi:hypothetical protein